MQSVVKPFSIENCFITLPLVFHTFFGVVHTPISSEKKTEEIYEKNFRDNKIINVNYLYKKLARESKTFYTRGCWIRERNDCRNSHFHILNEIVATAFVGKELFKSYVNDVRFDVVLQTLFTAAVGVEQCGGRCGCFCER